MGRHWRAFALNRLASRNVSRVSRCHFQFVLAGQRPADLAAGLLAQLGADEVGRLQQLLHVHAGFNTFRVAGRDGD